MGGHYPSLGSLAAFHRVGGAVGSVAVEFLHDGALVEFWTSLVGIDRHAWQEHAQQAQQRAR